MRVRLPIRRMAFAGAAALAALLMLLPMRLLAGWIDIERGGLSARAVRGSIWFGRFVEADFRGIPLGDLDARLALLPLMTGQARLAFTRPDGFAATLVATPRGSGVADMTTRLALGQRFAPMPVAAIDLADLEVHFAGGLCDRAEGRVKVELQGDFGGLSLPGGLSGAARCDAGKLLFPLASQSGMERLAIRIAGDGSFRAEMIARPRDETAAKSLGDAGFTTTPAGQILAIEGRL